MSPTLSGSIFTVGTWTSPTLLYSNGSHDVSRNNSWTSLTWSGLEPTDSTLLTSVLNASDNTIIPGLGSMTTGSSPVPLSGLSAVSGLDLKVRFHAEWIAGSVEVRDWSVVWLPAVLGDKRGSFTIRVSGSD